MYILIEGEIVVLFTSFLCIQYDNVCLRYNLFK